MQSSGPAHTRRRPVDSDTRQRRRGAAGARPLAARPTGIPARSFFKSMIEGESPMFESRLARLLLCTSLVLLPAASQAVPLLSFGPVSIDEFSISPDGLSNTFTMSLQTPGLPVDLTGSGAATSTTTFTYTQAITPMALGPDVPPGEGDLRVVTEGSKPGDAGIPHGAALASFAEATVTGNAAELAAARDALLEAVGPKPSSTRRQLPATSSAWCASPTTPGFRSIRRCGHCPRIFAGTWASRASDRAASPSSAGSRANSLRCCARQALRSCASRGGGPARDRPEPRPSARPALPDPADPLGVML